MITDTFLYGLYTDKNLDFGEFPNHMDKFFPECDARALIELLGVLNGAMVVELGGYKGRSTAVLASRVVDVYIVRSLSDYLIDDLIPLKDNLVKLGLWSRLHLLLMESESGARIFPDNSLDMVLMDGDRRYASARADMMQWFPKIKKEGILCGHGCAGYYSQYPDAVKSMIDSKPESESPAVEVGGTNVKYIGYPGLIKALYDCFEERYSVFPDTSIWYRKKEK